MELLLIGLFAICLYLYFNLRSERKARFVLLVVILYSVLFLGGIHGCRSQAEANRIIKENERKDTMRDFGFMQNVESL